MSFKLLSVAVLSLGLATSAMAQSAGSAGGASGNSGNTNEGGGSGAATTMQAVPDNTITNSTMSAPGTGTVDDMQSCSSSTQGAGAPGSSKTDTAATDPACKDK